MKKAILLFLLSLLIIPAFAATAPFGYDLEKDIHRNDPKYNHDLKKQENSQVKKETSTSKTTPAEIQYYGDNTDAQWKSETAYYPSATLNSAVKKYKSGNYSGALQELISITKRDSSNPLVYYYLGMAYTQVGNKDQAVKAYETVIKLNSDKTLSKYAMKGRDCLVGGPTCSAEETEDETDVFVKAPYGNGLSDTVNKELKEQQLRTIKQTINKKQDLEERDINKIQDFDDTSSINNGEKTAVTNEEILSAIETLKKAGIAISINPYQQNFVPNNEYAQMSMLLGNNNNNNNYMMSMIPYMMNQTQQGQNLDPQIFQSMMMNSMLPDFTFNDKKD